MPILDPIVFIHHVSIKNGSKLVKQKLRTIRPKDALKFKVLKQCNVGFLKVTSHPKWLANSVSVLKNRTNSVQIDHRDLNKVSPNDDFHLIMMDILVDNTALHGMHFMDEFFSYNHVAIKSSIARLW